MTFPLSQVRSQQCLQCRGTSFSTICCRFPSKHAVLVLSRWLPLFPPPLLPFEARRPRPPSSTLSYSVSLLLPHSKEKTVNPPPPRAEGRTPPWSEQRGQCAATLGTPEHPTGHHSLELVLAPCDLPQLFHGSGLLHLHRHGRTLAQHHVETLSLPVSLAPLFCAGG